MLPFTLPLISLPKLLYPSPLSHCGGRITRVDEEGKLVLDCRKSVVFPLLTFDDLQVGAVVDAVVANMKVNGMSLV